MTGIACASEDIHGAAVFNCWVMPDAGAGKLKPNKIKAYCPNGVLTLVSYTMHSEVMRQAVCDTCKAPRDPSGGAIWLIITFVE